MNAVASNNLPNAVLHADWSKDPDKRWASSATLNSGIYTVEPPSLVTPDEIRRVLRAGGCVVGFDFPIGVPAAYAHRVGAKSFLEWLRGLGAGPYASFFEVAESESQISLYRPFYPQNTKSVTQAHLIKGLGLASKDELFRRCEVAEGRQACPLFWTLGSNQVGRGALTGWREVIRPAVAQGAVVWPFGGPLDELLAQPNGIIVETYPGDVYGYVGATLPPVTGADGKTERGKRSHGSRCASSPSMLAWATRVGVTLAPKLIAEVRDGFGADKYGEDRFDAVVGLLGMIAVLLNLRKAGAPQTPDVQHVEGWILGRAP